MSLHEPFTRLFLVSGLVSAGAWILAITWCALWAILIQIRDELRVVRRHSERMERRHDKVPDSELDSQDDVNSSSRGLNGECGRVSAGGTGFPPSRK